MPQKREQFRLTDRTVAKLKAPDPSGQQTYYWDRDLKGFGVICSGIGNAKSFFVQARLPGKRVPIPRGIGRFGMLTTEQARQLAREKLAAISQGRDPRDARSGPPLTRTLWRAMQWYLSSRSTNLRGRSLQKYEDDVSNHLKDWHKLPLSSITRSMVTARHREIADEVEARARERARADAAKHLRRAERVEASWPEAAERHRAKYEAALSRSLPSGAATANAVMRALRAIWNDAADSDPELGA